MPPLGHRSLRWRKAVLLPLLLFWIAAPSWAETPAFSGTVRDAVGNVLAGVEVLIAPHGTSSVQPIAVVSSDVEGQFSVSELVPGNYRIAALKHGYLTFVGQVNTGARRWVELVLQPNPARDVTWNEPLPRNASWGLRLPRRSILHDTDPSAGGRPAVDDLAEHVDVSPTFENLQLQVDQLLDFRTEALDGSDEQADLQGTETRMQLASGIGDRGNIRVDGRHRSLDNGGTADQPVSSRRGSDLSLDFSYDTTPDSSVAVSAFYNKNDLSWARPLATYTVAPSRQEQRNWGYDASWSKQLDPVSRVKLKFDFEEGSLLTPRPTANPSSTHHGQYSNRTVSATGSYEVVPSSDHQVQVEFGAALRELPLPDQIDPDTVEPTIRFREASGLTVGINAQDTWFMSGPFSLIYGLGYRHAMDARDASLIVPRLGGSWSVDRMTLRLILTYHALADDRFEPASTGEGPGVPQNLYGYEAGLDLPLSRRVSLRGSAESEPIQMEFAGFSKRETGTERPIFITDGNASVRRHSISVQHDATSTLTYLELSRGRAEGVLAAVMPYELPFQMLSERSLSYRDGTLGMRFTPTGTHFVLQYREVNEQAPRGDLPLAARSAQETVELNLIQDLTRLRVMGTWRFLAGLRMASVGADNADALIQVANTPEADVTNRRVSAGLSVLF